MNGSTALIIFLLIGSLGFFALIVTLVLGDLFEFANLDADGNGVLDARVISVFMTTFGGVGALCAYANLGTAISSLLAVVGGVALGYVVFLFARFLHRQQASSVIGNRHLVGRVARVLVTIPPGGMGQVSVSIGGERVERLARGYADKPLPSGTSVLIEEIADDAVVVSEAPALAPPTS